MCLGALASGGRDAAAQEAVRVCTEAAPTPKITVTVEVADFVYDHGRSLAELNSATADSQTAAGHVLGRTAQRFEFDYRGMQSLVLPRDEGGACVGFADGTVTIRLRTSIFVARELSPDSCLHEQVLSHEERHAKVGRRLFTEFGAKLEDGFAQAFRKQPFVLVDDPAAARAAAQARVNEIFEPLYGDFRSVYRKRQAIIDTSGEFARVEAACPGEMGRVAGQ